MLTVKDQEFAKVKALDLGADEYITKPFSHIELMARLHAVQHRSALPQCKEAQEPLSIGRLWIDFTSREVRVDQQPVRLTPIEYDLLEVLALNAGRAIPHQTLLEKVWGDEYADCGQYLKVYTQRLRIKLGDDARNPKLLVTERGFGYNLLKSMIEHLHNPPPERKDSQSTESLRQPASSSKAPNTGLTRWG